MNAMPWIAYYAIEEKGCEVAKWTLRIPGGRASESKKGLAQAVTACMKKTTQNYSYKKLQNYLDDYALAIEIYPTSSHIVLELHCHSDYLEKGIAILSEIWKNSVFRSQDWSLMRNQLIEQVEQSQYQTDYWADKLITEVLHSENSPRGYYSSVEDYMAISIQDISDYYSQYIQSKPPTLFIAGDVSTDISTKFWDLEKKTVQKENLEHRIIAQDLNYYFPKSISKKLETSSQASIRLGLPILRRNFEDFLAIEIIHTFLGGYYLSALMRALRIESGYTYGVYSQLAHYSDYSVFTIQFEADENVVKSSFSKISEVLKRLNTTDASHWHEANLQYKNQWAKQSERSLQEILYVMQMEKLGFDYTVFKHRMIHLDTSPCIPSYENIQKFTDFSAYSKVVVC
jgi:predicted Zn-dependent peptidase